MRVLTNKEIDFEKWDKALLNSELPLVFAQSFYLNSTSPGWHALIEGNYSCILPLTQKKKLGITYLIQPPFTPQLGVYGRCQNALQDARIELLSEKFRYISIELNGLNATTGFASRKKRTFVIWLDKNFKYNSNTKRNIAKARKGELSVRRLRDSEAFILSSNYLNPFMKRKLKLSSVHIRVFENLILNSAKAKTLFSYVVTNSHDKVCALGHFISNGKHAVFLKGTNFDKNSGSMHFLMDHAIAEFKKENVRLFDFGGGQSDSLAQFYSGFGAVPFYYSAVTINKLPKAIRWIKK